MGLLNTDFLHLYSEEDSTVDAISKEYFKELERKTLLLAYQRLLDKGVHPESVVRFVLSSAQKDN